MLRANAARNSLKNSDRAPGQSLIGQCVDGLDVYNGQNQNIGKIQDVVFDKDGKVAGYILSVGGFLGMGTRYVAVDLELGIDHL